jgi:hypothetical protein
MDVATLLKIGRQVLIKKWRQSPFVPRTTLDEELVKAGLDFPRWLDRRREGRRMYVEIADEAVQRLRTVAPEHVARAIASADRALAHTFDLLGSGDYVPSDPDRPAFASGYRPIDWAWDPVRKARFPNSVPVKEWKLFEMRPQDADVKFPWELARCQHFSALGQAFRLSGDDRYAVEILDQIEDFTAANPVGIGVNWTCTMDVGLRAVNWAIGLALVKACDAMPEVRWQAAYGALFEHGRFIYANLENTYEVTSNHFLSNVIGLHFIAAEFSETASGQTWDAFARKALETEIDVQVLSDGADFESSVPYHRLVTELFLGSYRLAGLQGRPLSHHYAERLADMIDYVVGVLRPDGLMPQLGDADDGRLHIFTDQAQWRRQDARHLLAPAAHILGRAAWAPLAGTAGDWEAAWWGFTPPSQASGAPKPPPDHVRLYADAGAFIARERGTYLLVTNAKVGTKGFGNHKHNEQLSFEWHVGGEPVIVDPGSYVYTSDFAARNLFRSTAYHSTLMIDGVEQNEFNPEWLFRMFEKADAEHVEHGTRDGRAFYIGRHSGWKRLETPVAMHARRFDLVLATGALALEDRLEGAGTHDLAWHFHLAPGATATVEKLGTALITTTGGTKVRVTFPEALAASINDAWYSPGYGVRVRCKALDLAVRADVAAAMTWAFALTPEPAPGATGTRR